MTPLTTGLHYNKTRNGNQIKSDLALILNYYEHDRNKIKWNL